MIIKALVTFSAPFRAINKKVDIFSHGCIIGYGGNMKKAVILIMVILFTFVSIWCRSGFAETLDLMENETSESEASQSKPVCCYEISSLSNRSNIAKDNIAFGFCTGSPIGGSVLMSLVTLVLLLVIGIFEFLFSLGNSHTVLDFTENQAMPLMIAAVAMGTIAGILLNLLYPYYDYKEKTAKKPLSNPAVLLERAGGCTVSMGATALVGWLIFRNLSIEKSN